MKTGSKDARHVVWTLGEYFFITYSYILILINVSITYIVSIDEIGERKGGDSV